MRNTLLHDVLNGYEQTGYPDDKRDEVLCILKHEVTGVNDRFGVKRMGLFGSVARDEAKDTSDIDILTDLDPPGFISEISRP